MHLAGSINFFLSFTSFLTTSKLLVNGKCFRLCSTGGLATDLKNLSNVLLTPFDVYPPLKRLTWKNSPLKRSVFFVLDKTFRSKRGNMKKLFWWNELRIILSCLGLPKPEVEVERVQNFQA